MLYLALKNSYFKNSILNNQFNSLDASREFNNLIFLLNLINFRLKAQWVIKKELCLLFYIIYDKSIFEFFNYKLLKLENGIGQVRESNNKK